MVTGAQSVHDVRLTLEDSRFLRAFHTEIPISVGHAYWHFDQPMHPDAIADLHRRLADSPISRRVVAPRVPGARHRWARATAIPPIRRHPTPLEPDRVHEWVDETIRSVHFDIHRGPMWDLSWATLRDGSTVVLLSGAHLVIDGPAFLGIVTELGAGRRVAPLPAAPRGWARWRDDLRDAADRIGAIARPSDAGNDHAIVTDAPSPMVRIPSTRAARSRGPVGSYTPPWVIAECSAEDLRSVARRHQGTVNSLLIALGASMAGASIDDPAEIVYSAVSRRLPGDLWTANTTRAAAIDTPADELARMDLAGIRRRCKAGYAEILAQPTDSRLSVLLQTLPHAAYRRLPSMPPTVMSSYMGTIPPEAAIIGGVRAASTTFFASFRCRSHEDLQAIATGPGTWLTVQGDRATLFATALGRGGEVDQAQWEAIVRRALEHWEIPATFA